MSYPDQEKQLDKVSEKVDIPQKPKSSPNEARIKPESRLPVGKLKWSKDDEAEQDTRVNLEKKTAEPEPDKEAGEPGKLRSVRADEQQKSTSREPKEFKAEPPSAGKNESRNPDSRIEPDGVKPFQPALSFNQHGERGNQGRPPSPDIRKNQDKADDSRQQEPAGHSPGHTGIPTSERPKKPLSLEDTLTPIHFKEYSIEPLPEEPKATPEFRTEVKKPAFVAEPAAFDLQEPEEERDVPEETSRLNHPAVKTAIKILWLPVLLFTVLIIGLIIGHSMIGNEPAGDVFDLNMWEHIYHLIYG
jgi:hypothetical protein